MKQFSQRALKVAAIVAVTSTSYLLAWPVEVNPAAWTPPPARSPTGVFAPNDRLTHIEKLAPGPVGPESIALDEKGYFPNGVAIGPGETYLLFNETSMYRTRRLWLTGEKASQVDTFIDNLPGFPDNISFDGEDTFWIALAGGPRSRATLDPLLPRPFLRKVIWRIPWLLGAAWTGEGYVLGLDLEGNVVHSLQDVTGGTYPDTTSAIEHNGWLYVGSFSADGVGRISSACASEPRAVTCAVRRYTRTSSTPRSTRRSERRVPEGAPDPWR